VPVLAWWHGYSITVPVLAWWHGYSITVPKSLSTVCAGLAPSAASGSCLGPARFGLLPETDASGDKGYNHRIYAMTAKDWRTFSASRLWFGPGFNCIDATVAHGTGGCWCSKTSARRRT